MFSPDELIRANVTIDNRESKLAVEKIEVALMQELSHDGINHDSKDKWPIKFNKTKQIGIKKEYALKL